MIVYVTVAVTSYRRNVEGTKNPLEVLLERLL